MTNSQTKISTFYYNKSGNFCLIVCHEALFNWKLFKLGSVSVKDIRKNVPILQVGGSSHILSTPPVVWVVLLHKMAFCQSFISTTVRRSSKFSNQLTKMNYHIQLWTERIAHLAVLWSKTTQTTGGVEGIWEDPPTCKMGTFFFCPWH